MTVWKHHETAAKTLTIVVDGHQVEARPGETVATVLLRLGYRSFGKSPVTGGPLAPACLMGVCFGCLCSVDGRPGIQACLETVQDGTVVETDVQVAP